MKPLIPQRIEAIATARMADERTLRLCFTEQDAILTSIQLSGLTYREIAARMGVSKSLVNAYAKGERELTDRRTIAFCNATGTMLLDQWLAHDRAYREVEGRLRERDRIAAIASYSQVAA